MELLVTRAVRAIDAASARHDGRARARPIPPTDASMRAADGVAPPRAEAAHE